MSFGKVKDEMTTQMAASAGLKPHDYKQQIRAGRSRRRRPGDAQAGRRQGRSSTTSRERQDEFPGVTASQVYVRDYPNGTLGAHLFGYVSEIGPDQLKEPAYEGLEPGDRIGATGLESQYDHDPPRPQRRDPGPGRRVRRAARPRAVADRARVRRQPEAHPRQEGPGGRRVGARRDRPPGRVRGDEDRRRLDPRHGLLADLRPERLHAAGLDRTSSRR